MRISMIVAVAENGAIGKDNKMLWHIPEDFKYFKATTMGKPMIMGRKTFESIGRPLPGRLNIVITRDTDWQADGVMVVHDLETALSAAFAEAEAKNAEEVMVVGGSQIYQQAMDQADRIYYTEIHKSYGHDASFPALDKAVWAETSRENHAGDGDKKPDYSFVVFDRK
ncbi:dihydrofolate reductase [Terasakiella sp. A23]|uniref:dihydrofolate reductase n=1 Tax=Terasakiella sp. FCG-A23 TaxID=3080561 RepID=UPI002953D763|nr:dihydrofolate reductase [Terasakiella sp. A23]MDV7340890.1 dihydrofolate reductase [Terasakiella sp. A23]